MNKYLLIILLSFPVLAFHSCNKPDISNEDEPETIIPCLPATLSHDAIAFYSFSGGSLSDITGRGSNLQNPTTAAPAPDRNGNPACAFRFNGSDFLTGPNTSFLNSLPGFTLSLWYKPTDSTRAGGDYEVLLSRDTSSNIGDRHGQWSVALYDCRKAVFARHSTAWDKHISPMVGNTCQNETNLRTGSWHHMAATWSSSGNLMSLYRDGVLQDTSSVSYYSSVQDKGALFVGRYYIGLIDDIIIFNRELTAGEVQQLAVLETCCSK
jgi:hypothetical protein